MSAPIRATCSGSSPNLAAANATQAEVQLCITAAVAGDTINVPAGSATYTQPLISTKAVSLIGAGQDQTNITLSASDFLEWNPTSAAVVRIAGFTISGTLGSALGAVNIDGLYTSFRADHLKFTNIGIPRAFVIGYQNVVGTNPAIYGLIDHITYNNNVCGQFGLQYGKEVDAWTGNDNWGTNQAMYVEDNTINFNVTSGPTLCAVWDMEHGARAVVRHNTIKNGVQYPHDTGSTQQSRGMRIAEVYANTFQCTVGNFDCGDSPTQFRGGSSLIYDNSIPLCTSCSGSPTGWENGNATEIWRISGSPGTSDPWNFKCNALEGTLATTVASDFRSHCSGSPFPACGENENVGQACAAQTCAGGNCGTCVNSPTNVPPLVTILSRIDGLGIGNYPCRDQVGRGKDSGDHTTQTLTPAYWWNNTDPNNSNAPITTLHVAPTETTYIQANRDVYLTNTSFNGTAGVGRGMLSARPATCISMVGYFATDTNTLYRCTSANTWTSYYTPYTYPHPLQSGTSATAPPTILRVTSVQ